MEEKRAGQNPEHAVDAPADSTAARTRPAGAATMQADDADAVKAAERASDMAREDMAARGFGDHKGVEGS